MALINHKSKLLVGLTLLFFCVGTTPKQEDPRFLSYVTEPSSIFFYWKDEKGQILKSIQNLKGFVESQGKELKFAMNGGMYKNDNSPQGLFIENNLTITPLDTLSGGGNFYLKPN